MKKSVATCLRALVIFSVLLPVLHMTTGLSHAQTPAISKVLVVQTLGNQSNKFVAGKDAAVLVYLDQPTAADASQQQVDIMLGGNKVATLQPSPSASTNTLVFLCPSAAACGNWVAGDYTFVATVNGATSQATATFQERNGLRVLAVPVRANYGSGDVRVTTGSWRRMGEFLRQVYPMSADRFTWTMGDEVDASGAEYNLTTEAGQTQLFDKVAQLQPKECFQTPRPPEAQCYDKVVAFVKDRMGPKGDLQGFTMGFNTNIVVESDQDAAATVAHEVGHNYNLGDEYNDGSYNCAVNPPVPSYVGKDLNTNDKPYSCQNSQAVSFESSGANLIKAETDVPFDISGRGLLPNMASFMGSGAPQERNWVSPADWNRIFDGLAPGGGAVRLMHLAAPPNAETQRWIYAQGFIGSDGSVQLEPWYDYDEQGTQQNSTGAYTLQALDANGAVLASTALEVKFDVVDNPRLLNNAFFVADMPFPEGTTQFSIVKGNQTLKNRPVSPNVPIVQFVSPVGGEAVNAGSFTVKWEAADADGDKLYYDLEYSSDGQNWEILDTDLQATQTTVDFSDLAGSRGATARFRITVTDGVNAAEAVSEPFSVAPKAPEVEIETPDSNATFAVGIPVSLQGIGYDLQDEDLTGNDQLVWTSDIQGELGKGDLLNLTNLKLGKHTITLKATNSFNLSGTASVVVTIAQAVAVTPTAAASATRAPGSTPPASRTETVPTIQPVQPPATSVSGGASTPPAAPTSAPPPASTAPSTSPPTVAAPPPPPPPGPGMPGTGEAAPWLARLTGVLGLALLSAGVLVLRRRRDV